MPRSSKVSGKASTARTPRARHRPHLIDACISALHLYGPSKTTVDKVVSLAGLSPGIVRFYFESKDAMLVASLEFLANEFEQQLILPVTERLDDPVSALALLVDLHLGPDLASARKVSVWYSFWGEASSRQEYYDICGSRDAKFEALIYELTRRVLAMERGSTADPEAIALGLIGTLEVLWQSFAFQTEAAIDRFGARRKAARYLSSVFPSSFGQRPSPAQRRNGPDWYFAGLVSDFRVPGAAAVVDTPTARLLAVRSTEGLLRTFVNRCPSRPHALVEVPGQTTIDGLYCRLHGHSFDLNGRSDLSVDDRLPERLCVTVDTLVWVSSGTEAPPPPSVGSAISSRALGPLLWRSHSIDAGTDVVRDLLRTMQDTACSESAHARSASIDSVRLVIWLDDHHRLEYGAEGLTVLEMVPGDSDYRSELREWRYDQLIDARRVRVLRYLQDRSLRALRSLAASTQRGLTADLRARTPFCS